ncbi:LysR family transcriptional regulator [Pseudomonas alcaligenes]|uniref:LysR family transcriptional regulator n=1 Tax=Aquipseudomonas alcaligenes TaxID=43263 RepID=A0ABR7S4I0_AQUAC|nr:LysR substrate-binding domain-containing protein [Pseudomonas alcaligenes]MBC9252485.1 LysR family transcriptional regulator [Pseudomonas alcaligenes]
MNDLRQLRHFVALADHGHFARAAEAVHLSQPALSRSIQALENSLGCTLVDRHSRGISLTAHGELVREHAKRLLAGSQALSNAVSQLGNLGSGEVRLGAGPYPAARLVPQAMGAFAERFPRVRLQLTIDSWQQLRVRLLNNEIELFVADIREFQDDARLQVEALRPHPAVLFCHPQHPLLARPDLTVKDLLDYPLAGTQLPLEVASALQHLSGGEAAPLSIECDNFMVLKELVSASHVLSMSPWDVIAQDVAAGRLAVLPLHTGMPAQRSAYGIVSRAGHSLSPGAAELQRVILEQDRNSQIPTLA